MFRCRYLVGAFAMAFALSACADSSMDEPVAEEPAPAAAAPEADVTAESVVPIPPQPKGTVEYFDMEVGDRVLFAFDSHELTDEGRLVLYRQAAWLAMFKTAEAVVEGHCDERGTREYNIALGARRAQAVKDFLSSAGVSEDRIQTVSYGKERPLALCSDESCWSQNRRAVTKIGGVPSS